MNSILHQTAFHGKLLFTDRSHCEGSKRDFFEDFISSAEGGAKDEGYSVTVIDDSDESSPLPPLQGESA